MHIRKQVNDLTLDDLGRFPVWEYALDEASEEGQDEATVRPYKFSGLLNTSDGQFIVRAFFTLADGTRFLGHVSPPSCNDEGPVTVHPTIVSEKGLIIFWCGIIEPKPTYLAQCYKMLGREASEVFPIRFEADVALANGTIAGTVPGFVVLEDFQSGKTRIVT
jgi:hypothetical protein